MERGVTQSAGHGVHFYGANERQLIANVASYISEGLRAGDGVLVVATEAHRQAFLEELDRLGVATPLAIRQRQLMLFDAAGMLNKFLVEDHVEWSVFEKTVTSVFRSIRARRRSNHTGIRVYGEIVGVLWQAGQTSVAIQIEHFWNKLKDAITFDLYCGYPVIRSNDTDVRAIVAAHTHVLRDVADNARMARAASDEIHGGMAAEPA